MKIKKISRVAVVLAAAASIALTACGSKYDDSSLDVTKIDVDKYVGTVGDYSNISVETDAKLQITDETVQQYIEYVLSSVVDDLVETDRAAENGDVVNIDFEGFQDGVAFQGGASEGYDLELGSGSFIPGFESGLVGYKAGDYVELNLTFPENYKSESLAGQDVVFKVTINAVKEHKMPELTDDVIVKFGIEGISTVDEFKAYVTKSLESTAENTYVNSRRDAVLKAVYNSSEFLTDDVPANLLNYYITQVKSTDQANATRYGISLENYVAGNYGKTMDEYNEECRVQALEMAKDALLCEKIARAENIVVTDKDIEEQMAIDAANYGYKSVDEFKAAMDGNDYKNYLVEIRVIDKILETATVTEIDYSEMAD